MNEELPPGFTEAFAAFLNEWNVEHCPDVLAAVGTIACHARGSYGT